MGFKLTMREFNLIHMFIRKRKEGEKVSDSNIREELLKAASGRAKAEREREGKKKEIISKIYQHEWDEDDDFFISNINTTKADSLPTYQPPLSTYQPPPSTYHPLSSTSTPLKTFADK